MLPQPPTVATIHAASTSTVSHLQNTTEMTDFTDDRGTCGTPMMEPKPRPQPKQQQVLRANVTSDLLKHAVKNFAGQRVHIKLYKSCLKRKL